MLDMYKKAGFPEIPPDFFGAAFTPVSSPGLNTPWYCVFGNHDDSVSGTVPSGIPPLEAMYTGSLKFEVPGSPEQAKQIDVATKFDPSAIPGILSAFTTPPRQVTPPDPSRAPFTPRQFIAAHLDPAHTGPGPPVGHGFAPPDAGETGIGYYSFEIAPGVVGISMDSTNRAGLVDGSLGAAQFQWIENTLRAGSSTYYDAAGSRVTESRGDTYFVLFSHHTSDTMDNLIPDPPENVLEPRLRGSQLLDLLHRFPNVLAWVNGHTHENKITRGPARPPPSRASGRSTPPRTSTTRNSDASSRSRTTMTERCRCLRRSSRRRVPIPSTTATSRQPGSPRCTANCRSTTSTATRS